MALMGLAAAAAAAAQEQALLAAPVELGRVSVVGARVPMTVGQETESLTVITRDAIERMGVANGADLLRQVPGVQVDQLGGPGGMSLAYIRGSDPNHVLVLVDGVRVNDPTNSRGGGVDLSSINPSDVERIEVLRGAASSIYGADAMGGVINVITRKGEPGFAASAGAGALGYRDFSARTTLLASGGSWMTISGSTLRDGDDAQGGSLKLDQLALAGHALVSDAVRVSVQLRHAERTSSAFPDDSGGIELAVIRTLERRRSKGTTVGVRGAADVQSWTVVLEGTGFEHQDHFESPGVAPGVRSDFGIPASNASTHYRRASALLSAVRHLSGGSELALGGEILSEHGSSNTVYKLFGTPVPADFDLRRDTKSAFAEIKWLPQQSLIVRAGLRYDAVDGAGSRTSPSLGLRYSIPKHDGALIASYSEGFKPPSFFALGLPPVLGGNPMLDPEHSKGLSLGYEERLPGGLGEASMAVFRRKYKDLVTFDNATNRLVNAEHVDVKGLELALTVRASASLSLQMHYTRLLSQVIPSGEPLRQRPKSRAGMETTWRFAPRARLVWRLECAKQIFDSSIPTGDLFLPPYVRNDLVLHYTASASVTVSAAIDNLADRDNQWYVGARSLGRRARIGASIKF